MGKVMARHTEKKSKGLSYRPDYAVPPGHTLKETLEALGMDQRDLATRTGLSPKHVNQMIQGVAPITQETALLLDRVTAVPARMWNNLEMNYRHRLAQQDELRDLGQEINWLKKFPVRELIQRGHIQKGLDKVQTLRDVLKFFGVASVAAWEEVWMSPRVAYRKSKAFQGKPEAMATWLRFGEIEAQAITCLPYTPKMFKSALKEIRKLTDQDPQNFCQEMKDLCAQAGVAVVFVKEIQGAPVSGASRWLTPRKAMIQLSLRHRSDDHFWFSFFHEAGHILLDGKKEVFIDVNHDDDSREESANRFAANMLIPVEKNKVLQTLTDIKSIRRFAREIGIAPGVVVGRLQHEGILKYHQANTLKQRYQWA